MAMKSSSKQIVAVAVMLTALGLLIWASQARLDQIVSARGEVVAKRDIEKVQHLEGGILDTLLVQEGDVVAKGQLMARLKGADRNAEHNATLSELVALEFENVRLSALINDSEQAVFEPSHPGNHSELIHFNQRNHTSSLAKNRSNDGLLIHDIEHKEQLIKSMQARLLSSREQLSVITEQLKIKQQLYDEEVSSYMEVLSMKTQYLNMYREIQNLEESIMNENMAITRLNKQLTDARATRNAEYYDKITQNLKQLKQKEAHLPRIIGSVQRLEVRSPVNGVVDRLNYNFSSAVVSPGDSFAEISPLDDVLMAEVKIPRKDIGFVEVGQSVKVKIDTYAFAKYGAIEGTVDSISKSSFEEKEEEFFFAKVKLDSTFLVRSGTQYHISPNMELAADIKTGDRSVLDYAIKPVMTALEEAFDER